MATTMENSGGGGIGLAGCGVLAALGLAGILILGVAGGGLVGSEDASTPNTHSESANAGSNRSGSLSGEVSQADIPDSMLDLNQDGSSEWYAQTSDAVARSQQEWINNGVYYYKTKLGVYTNSHASKHPEAQSIRDCLDNNGPYQVWRSLDKMQFFFICQFEPGRWGIQIVRGDNADEQTAFQPDGCDTLGKLVNWLTRQAVRYTGKIPWLK